MILCRLGFHNWLYALPSLDKNRGNLRTGRTLKEHHCPTCKCTWLQDGVSRTCVLCGVQHNYSAYGGHGWID
jgi:hypothetical protein